jgi:(S)-ureidoglycine aminohydrolase
MLSAIQATGPSASWMAPGGGTTALRDDGLEHFFYVIEGKVAVTAGTQTRGLGPGGYAFVPPGTG